MRRIDLPEYGYGRVLRDSLMDAAALHPELFGFPDPLVDAAHLPDLTDDRVLQLRMNEILEFEGKTTVCNHLREVGRRAEAPGIKFYPEGVSLGSGVHVFAAVPQARMCSVCWEQHLPAARRWIAGKPCDRCGTGALPRDPAVMVTALAHCIFTFFCCGHCVEDLEGGDGHD